MSLYGSSDGWRGVWNSVPMDNFVCILSLRSCIECTILGTTEAFCLWGPAKSQTVYIWWSELGHTFNVQLYGHKDLHGWVLISSPNLLNDWQECDFWVAHAPWLWWHLFIEPFEVDLTCLTHSHAYSLNMLATQSQILRCCFHQMSHISQGMLAY